MEHLADIFKRLEGQGVHNLNLVTPTHFTPQILQALELAKPTVPVVMNCGGYERVETLLQWEGKVQVYLPDLDHQPEVTKTFSISKAKFLSGLRFCEGFRANTPEYDLSDYNCCNATIDAANACGIWIQRTRKGWIIGKGLNPTSLANDLGANNWHHIK